MSNDTQASTKTTTGWKVNYRSGETVGRAGVIINQRRTRRGTPEYLVRFEDGTEMWLLASNVKF